MLPSTSLLPSVFLAATGLTGCLDWNGERSADDGMNAIAEGIAAHATTLIRLVANLDATESTPMRTFDVQDSAATSNFSTTITCYDALGAAHPIDIYFRRLSAGKFEYHVLANGDELDPPSAGISVELGHGTLCFDTDGALLVVEVEQEVTATFAGTEDLQTIQLDWGTPKSSGGLGTDGVTMYARPSNMSFQSQNGYAGGRFAGIDVRSLTEVYALYTNGSLVRLEGLNAA